MLYLQGPGPRLWEFVKVRYIEEKMLRIVEIATNLTIDRKWVQWRVNKIKGEEVSTRERKVEKVREREWNSKGLKWSKKRVEGSERHTK